jgi:hypothetical protein
LLKNITLDCRYHQKIVLIEAVGDGLYKETPKVFATPQLNTELSTP